MDIQVASNFERALFEASGRDAVWVGAGDGRIRARRGVSYCRRTSCTALRARYAAFAIDDAETLATIKRVHAQTGRLIDPHTAVGLAAGGKARRPDGHSPVVVLSTAHRPSSRKPLPRQRVFPAPCRSGFAALYENEERASVLPRDGAAVRAFIETRLSRP